MATPINQGTLNRLLSALIVPAFPELTITAPFCTPEGIRFTTEGETAQSLRQMTGVVQSPEPYQMGVIEAHILKTNGLGQLWELQKRTNVLIGDVMAVTDTAALAPYPVSNCSIAQAVPSVFNGTDAGYLVVVRGTFYINSALFGNAPV